MKENRLLRPSSTTVIKNSLRGRQQAQSFLSLWVVGESSIRCYMTYKLCKAISMLLTIMEYDKKEILLAK